MTTTLLSYTDWCDREAINPGNSAARALYAEYKREHAAPPAFSIDAEQRREILRQIGTMNVCAISGGRVTPLPDGVELPVGSGYRVRVRLTPADDYTVERVFVRKGREFSKGLRERVYCDQVGEAAYEASCFRNSTETHWPEAAGK